MNPIDAIGALDDVIALFVDEIGAWFQETLQGAWDKMDFQWFMMLLSPADFSQALAIMNLWMVDQFQLLNNIPQKVLRRVMFDVATKTLMPGKTKVIRMDKALSFTLETILIDGYNIVSLQNPWFLTLIERWRTRSKLFHFLLNPTVEQWLTDKIAKVFKIGIMKWVLIIWNFAITVIRLGGLALLCILAMGFISKMMDGEANTKALQQFTKRKSVSSEMGPIRRRMIGGNKP